MDARASLPTDAELPFLSSGPGIGGRLKCKPHQFVVTEIAEPCSAQGAVHKHCVLTLRRTGMTTEAVRHSLSQLFGVSPDEIGYAGLKDACAVATQSFSLPRDRLLPLSLRCEHGGLESIVSRIASDARLEVVGEPSWQQSKLRVGQLVGNHFDIIVSACDCAPSEALQRCAAIASALSQSGWANFYGPQRFGKSLEHAVRRGVQLLCDRMGERSRQRHAHAGWLGSLILSGLQSFLFNCYLAERIRRGHFEEVCFLSEMPTPGPKPDATALGPNTRLVSDRNSSPIPL